MMWRTIRFFVILVSSTLICSCGNESNSITEFDFEFVELQKRETSAETITAIDSAIANKQISKVKLALIQLEKGRNLVRMGKYEDAAPAFESSRVLFEKLKITDLLPEIYWHLGSAYIYLSKKNIAIEHLLKALEFSKEADNKRVEANVYSSLSHAYYLYEDFDKATNYQKAAMNIQIEMKDTLHLSISYNNLAVLYRNFLDHENALKYNLKSLEINRYFKDSASIAKSYNNIGLALEGLGRNEESIDYYLQAAELNQAIVDLNTSPLENLGNYYINIGDEEKAEFYFLKALAIVNKSSDDYSKRLINESLLNIALAKKDFESAIYYKQSRDSLHDFITKGETEEKLNLVENQYKLVAKEKDLRQAKESIKNNRIIFISILGFIVLLVLFWFQWLRNKKLKDEKEKIVLEQKVLRSQMNPHFIFNALSAIQNSLMDNNPIKSATYLSRFAKLIRQNFDFINHKTILLSEELDALTNYMDTQKLRFQEKFDYVVNVGPNINQDLIEIPPLLLQPFVENAIEHGFKNKKEKGMIRIEISDKEDAILYSIKDNGSGYDLSKKNIKDHAIDIFKKRMKLLETKNEKNFMITSSIEGTHIEFSIKK